MTWSPTGNLLGTVIWAYCTRAAATLLPEWCCLFQVSILFDSLVKYFVVFAANKNDCLFRCKLHENCADHQHCVLLLRFFYSAWMDVLLWLLCEFVFEANILKLMWALWVPRSPFGAVTVLSPFGAVTVLSPFGVVSVVTLVKTNSELLSVCVCK